MSDGYEINVAKLRRDADGKERYHHFFATTLRSAGMEHEARKLYSVLKEKFPESEGYSITVTRWRSYGEHMNFEKEG